MDLFTRGQHAHTSSASACRQPDRSATRLMMHSRSEEFAISAAALVLCVRCVYAAHSLHVCCSCAALCAVWCMGSSVYACACSTRAPSEVSSAVERCSR